VLAGWCRDFCVVDAFTLVAALGNQAGLVALKVAIGVSLDLEDPLDWYSLGAFWKLSSVQVLLL
jgi:hypothetical protein